jgi:hypothetical protein
MNIKSIAVMTCALTLLAAQACSSDSDPSGSGGSGGGTSSSSVSSSSVSSSSVSSSATSSASASTGGVTGCMPTLPASPAACPDTPTAEGAFEAITSTCGLTKEDLDFSDANNPTLTAGGKAKICASCECQQKAFDYYAAYANCMDSNKAGNTALSKNIHAEAVACQK